MVDDDALNAWFVREVLPLERALTSYIRRNWRVPEDVFELRQDIYENALIGARRGLPQNARPYVYTVARNHLINHAKRARSEEHTSELQSLMRISYAVLCLKQKINNTINQLSHNH